MFTIKYQTMNFRLKLTQVATDFSATNISVYKTKSTMNTGLVFIYVLKIQIISVFTVKFNE